MVRSLPSPSALLRAMIDRWMDGFGLPAWLKTACVQFCVDRIEIGERTNERPHLQIDLYGPMAQSLSLSRKALHRSRPRWTETENGNPYWKAKFPLTYLLCRIENWLKKVILLVSNNASYRCIKQLKWLAQTMPNWGWLIWIWFP